MPKKSSKVKFYDVVAQKMVNAEVTGKASYTTCHGTKTYSLKGVGKSGNNLSVFCTKDIYDSFDVKVIRSKKTKK